MSIKSTPLVTSLQILASLAFLFFLTACGSEKESQALERRASDSPATQAEHAELQTSSPAKSAKLEKRTAMQTASLKRRAKETTKAVDQSDSAVPPEPKSQVAPQAKKNSSRKKAAVEKTLSGREIADRVEGRPGYKTSESTALQMILTNKRGKSRKREFLRYQMSTDGGKKTLMKFLRPRDIKDTGTLNQEVIGKDDIQHLYLPAAKKLRRISSSNKSQSWVGSDFSFEDLAEVDLDDFTFDFLGTEVFEGHTCYKYSMIPKDPENSMYSKQIRWARVGSFLPVRWEYFDKQGKLLKTLVANDFKKVNGIDYAWNLYMENVQEKHSTRLVRRWLKLDTGMDTGMVSIRHLKKSIERYNHPEGLKSLWKETLPN